ncbi:hypothetical protein AKG33_00755 [Dichelobacter nodosus]|nr:hypothetical protein [Dichelobacter nodosus]KNZ40007.1 hypothetical protein AKG33_00755 [Dichelobacter nodosus]
MSDISIQLPVDETRALSLYRDALITHFPLTFQRWFIDNQHIAAISAVEIDLSLIRKRVQRFYRAIFMPKICLCYGSMRGRTARFAVSFVAVRSISRMLSPSLTLVAAVNLQLRKETAHV